MNRDIYKRCRCCGQVLNQFEIEDNGELCDYCFNDMDTWKQFPFGGEI